MEKALKIWNYFSGHKTEISGVLFGISQILKATGQIEVADGFEKIAAYILTIGLSHKVVKAVKK
ncbi:hypothetical protein KAR91_54740 [Candidatus Pacearchaeota archaeon]|nr:hypothetical protein [Candidatus Pacearchaeota archaeon]